MDLQTRKIAFVQAFLKLQSEEIISHLEKVLWKETSPSVEEEVEPMSMEQFKGRIAKSMEDSKHGRLIKDSDLKAKIEKWA